jgi:ABC-type antimicrobial peptide transport system permease subunit
MVAGIGIVTGVGMSLALTRMIATLLSTPSGTMPHFDPVTYGVAIGGVLLIALTATVLPARRAATVDPMQVLRSE